jgi:uncharacterized membrane protein
MIKRKRTNNNQKKKDKQYNNQAKKDKQCNNQRKKDKQNNDQKKKDKQYKKQKISAGEYVDLGTLLNNPQNNTRANQTLTINQGQLVLQPKQQNTKFPQ